MFEENDLVIVVDDPNKIVYKINKITDTLVELKGYKSRTKMVTSLDSLSKAPKELVDKFHSKNLLVNIWTLNDEALLDKYLEMGVDMITSDFIIKK